MYETICPRQTDLAVTKALAKMGLPDAKEVPGYLDWDIRTGATVWDQAWSDLFGFSRGIYCGHTVDWVKSIHLEDLSDVMASLNDHLTGKSAHFLAEYRLAEDCGKSHSIRTCGVVVGRNSVDRPTWVIMLSQKIPRPEKTQDYSFLNAASRLPAEY